MRRSLLAIPAVVALGAGGYLLWHHETAPTSPPSASTHAAPGSPAASSSAAPMIKTPDGRRIPMPESHAASAPALPSTGSASAPTEVGSAASSPDVAAVNPPPVVMPNARDYMRHAHPRNAPGGEPPKLTVPLPGVDKLRNKLGTQAKCKGPEAEAKYAAMQGQERTEFAEGCRRVGVTLPP